MEDKRGHCKGGDENSWLMCKTILSMHSKCRQLQDRVEQNRTEQSSTVQYSALLYCSEQCNRVE